MTEKQALHCMKFNCESAVCEECDVYGTVGTDHCFEDACREAIKALEKQIPKEVSTMKYRNDYNWTCNSCNTTFEYIRYTADKPNYCPNCGQAIKWERGRYE